MLALLVPAFTFHTLAIVVLVIVACCIVFWLLSKAPVPEPFNYVLYGVMALVALWLLFSLVGKA